MSRRLLPRGSGAALAAYLLPIGEVVYDSGTKVLRLGDGVTPGGYQIGKGVPLVGGGLDIASAGPTWASYSSIFNAGSVNVNGFPTADMFGNGAVKAASSLMGAISIPVTDTGIYFGAGVSGYAQTYSTTQSAVGVFAFAGIGVNGGNAFAGNSVLTNTKGVNTGTGNGHDGNVMVGYEIDLNIMKKAGGVTPTINALSGLRIIGDSDTIGSGSEVYGAEIDSPGINQSPILKWFRALKIRDGIANEAISVGAALPSRTGAPTSSASMKIEFITFDSGAARQISNVYADATANLILSPTNGVIFKTNSGTVTALTVTQGGFLGLGGATPLAPFQINADGAPAGSGNMTTGSVFAVSAAAQALNIGAYNAGGYTWINSAFANNSGTGAPLVFAVGAVEAFRLDTSKNLLLTGGGVVGYGVGSGGAVTQITSRTTGVTLNKSTGAITLFSAAGSTTPATFTVTNSKVTATDTIDIHQKSGTNLYQVLVTAVAAGSFNVTFFTTGGTATDAPVFNFTINKGSAT